VRLVDQARCQRRLEGLTAQYFARSRHWAPGGLDAAPAERKPAGRVPGAAS
jgi:hypothetical protein